MTQFEPSAVYIYKTEPATTLFRVSSIQSTSTPSSQNRGRKGNGTSMERSTENSLASTG